MKIDYSEDNVIITQNLGQVHLSILTKNFLYKIGKIKNGDTFPLDELRNLYSNDKSLFFHVLNELSLYGCNFHSKKANTLFPPDITETSEVLYIKTDDLFSPFELDRCKLWNICNSFDIKYKNNLNRMYVDRLIFILKNNEVKQKLIDIGFETKIFMIGNQENKNDEKNREMIVSSTAPLIIPDFFLKLVSFLMCGGPYVYGLLNKAGFYKFKDLLNISNLEQIYKLFDQNNYYLNGRILYEFSIFLRDLNSAKEILGNHGFSIMSLFQKTENKALADVQNQLCTICINSNNNNALDEFSLNKNIYVSGAAADYLKLFNIDSLIQLGIWCFEKPLNVFYPKGIDFGISNFNPYIVIDSIACSIKEKSSFYNPELLDNELRKVEILKLSSEIQGKIDLFYKKADQPNKVIDILAERSRGKTLEEISKGYDVTRERIRQIESKYLEKNYKLYANFLDNLLDVDPSFDLNETKKITGLYNFVKAYSENYKYDDLGILLNTKYVPFVNKKIKEISSNLRPSSIFEMEIATNKFICNLVPYFLINEKKIIFDPYPIFHSTKSVSMVEIAEEILEEKGIKGFNLNKDIEDARKRFAPYEKYGEKPSIRILQSRLLRVENIINVGSSIIAKSKFLTNEQKETCKRIIENYPINSDYGTKADEIFNANKNELLSIGIDNSYFFYGICSFYRYSNYYYSGRSLRIFKSESQSKSLTEIVKSYMLIHGPIVKSKVIQETLGVKEVGFEQIEIITKYDSDSYILKEQLSINEKEFNAIRQLIDETIEKKGYCLSNDIFDSKLVFDASLNTFLATNYVKNSEKRLIYLLETVFERNPEISNLYYFSHHINAISLASNPIKSLPDLVLQHFGNKQFTRFDFEQFLDECKLGGDITRKETIKKCLVLVNEDLYVAAKEINVNLQELKEINNLINSRFSTEPAITTNDVINYLNSCNFESSYKNNPIGLCSAISSINTLDWVRPQMNLNLYNKAISVIIANVKVFGSRDITLKDVFLKVVMNEKKEFMSYNDIDELLRNYGLLSVKLSYDVFLNVFHDYIRDGLVVCK